MLERKSSLSRRDFLKFAAMAAATGLAASCAPATTPAPTEAPPEAKPTEAPPEAKPTEAPPEAKPTEAPAKPKEVTITFAGDADIETLKMDTWGSLLAYQVYRAIGLTLVHYKVKEGEDGFLYYIPGEYDFVGAESAEMAPDMKSITWKIRQGLTFDNGKPITAHEWKKTFDWFYDRRGWAGPRPTSTAFRIRNMCRPWTTGPWR